MKAYITSTGIISPQETHNRVDFPDSVREEVNDRLLCMEPDYKVLINPVQLRRMPRILKMGLAAARLCINRSGGINPDGIIVGTGLGCLDNLEKFLLEILENNEHITSVLPFINSTHNAVAAHIAMLLQNHGYNLTYCHRGLSFESALDDALMNLEERKASHILLGGIDESTNDFMKLHSYLGFWKKPISNLLLLEDKTPGSIAGEGSAFFMLSSVPSGDHHATVEGVHTFITHDTAKETDIIPEIDLFLQKHQTDKKDISLLLTGMNGDVCFDPVYRQLRENYFLQQTGLAWYKHLCGEYYTSSSFALWLASVIIERQAVPEITELIPPGEREIEKILIYNHTRNTEHALILVSHGKI
jgi:3-oxoacyl-[acyl-carrier-protein] synthase II